MAESLQQIKKRIKTANSIAQIAKAMEMIAASKIKRAQTAVEKNRPYADRVKYVVQKILSESDNLVSNSSYVSIKNTSGKKLDEQTLSELKNAIMECKKTI